MHETEKQKGSPSVVSDSLRPHGLQPTRLLHPWDFPDKSTGVGCHCLLLIIHYLKSNMILNFLVWRTNSFTFSSCQSSLISFAWSSQTLKPFGMWNPEHKICPHRKSSVNCHHNEKGENGLKLLRHHPFASQNTVSPLSIQPGKWAADCVGFSFVRMGWVVKGGREVQEYVCILMTDSWYTTETNTTL